MFLHRVFISDPYQNQLDQTVSAAKIIFLLIFVPFQSILEGYPL